MTFVHVPKGTFYMGWDGTKIGMKTTIDADFELAVHAVTQGQWQAVMGSNPSTFGRHGTGSGVLKYISDAFEELYQKLWHSYFQSINIEARKNTKLHLQHVPRRYWKYLTEKQVMV